jgi:hypothetical protein
VIQNGQAVPVGNVPAMAFVNGSSIADVVLEAQVRVPRNLSRAGLVARYTPAGGGYTESYYWARLVRVNGQVRAEIHRYMNGRFRQLGKSVAIGKAGGFRLLRLEVIGDRLKLFVNGNLKVNVRDTVLSGPGQVGLRARFGGATDNFTARPSNTVVSPAPTASASAPAMELIDGHSLVNVLWPKSDEPAAAGRLD